LCRINRFDSSKDKLQINTVSQLQEDVLQVLSRALIELYRLAGSTPLDQFPGEVLRVFRDCFDYDGATLRMGEAHARSGLQITWSDLCRCDKSILQDYAELPAQDPITPMPMFLNSLSAPFRVDCLPLYRQQRLRDLDTSARKHGLRHLLVYGDSPVGECIEYWILLCRTRDPGFTRLEVARLYYLWPHLSRVVDMNRSSALWNGVTHRVRAVRLRWSIRAVGLKLPTSVFLLPFGLSGPESSRRICRSMCSTA
jgi:hypothetical protein